jgi:diphthamide biosynthesis protein 3
MAAAEVACAQRAESAAPAERPRPPTPADPAPAAPAPTPAKLPDEKELDAPAIYDEVEIEDMQFDEATLTYRYPCPCGDSFCISEDDLYNGEVIARCPACSLIIRVIYDPKDFSDA